MLLHRRGGGRRGHGAGEALVEWARDALERGLDGPALRISVRTPAWLAQYLSLDVRVESE